MISKLSGFGKLGKNSEKNPWNKSCVLARNCQIRRVFRKKVNNKKVISLRMVQKKRWPDEIFSKMIHFFLNVF